MEVLGFGTVRSRRAVGPVVGVLYPTDRWVEDIRGLVDRVGLAPVVGRRAAVDGPGPVEIGATLRHEVRVPIGDVAVGVGEDGVVR